MPETLTLRADRPADIERAAALLRAGGLVAFATETVYGLGANALSADAVAGIFHAKQRPSWDPLIVHIAGIDQLDSITVLDADLRDRVNRLAEAFWPGPLTLLLPRRDVIPDAVTAGRALVGVRIPGHPAALALLRAVGLPVAAPSANRFGHISPTTEKHVLADLDGRIDAVLDAGPTPVGIESTVIDPTQTPIVLYRPGAISAEQIEAATGVPVTIFVPPDRTLTPEALPSPGVGMRHYAPRARVVLTGPTPEAIARATFEHRTDEIGILLPVGWPPPAADVIVQPWAAWERADRLAATLFAGLRALDVARVDCILCPLPAPGPVYDAIRDRLLKAARQD